MMNDQRAITTVGLHENHQDDDDDVRDIHALTPTHPQSQRTTRRENNWETRSSTSTEGASSENSFGTMSREFNALVVAGSTIANHGSMDAEHTHHGGGGNNNNYANNLTRIGEEEEERNPLAIVPDSMHPMDPVPSPQHNNITQVVVGSTSSSRNNIVDQGVTIHQVKKDEVESKIYAWQTAKISKINNRFKREDAVIHGWEGEEVQKATTWMKKVERKLEEKRAKALEKMQNDVAKARRKAEERRASAEAKRGTKVARVLEIANLMRTLGRPPTKRSFF
ncbi:Remorin 4.1 [Thalictrum thalictroides]|uniref:Remorin 4.1 n=1 Tax=Thalictrum thalictroides TaxID=46969 RepID=A0A7J6W7Y5_THATH|nr:Remorin 4.1 [Thalictrum thalictroides]